MSSHPKSPFASSVMYRVGGRSYPLKTVRNCGVCHSTLYRTAVENYLLQGFSFQTIVDRLPADAGISITSIKTHANEGHMPLIEDARRAIIERRATELDWNPETDTDRVVDHVGFLRLALSDVTSRLMSREIEPDIKDGIAIAKALSQIDIDNDTEDRLAMYASLIRLMFEAAQRHMDHQAYQDFSEELMASPAFRSMMGMPEPVAVGAGVITINTADEDEEAV